MTSEISAERVKNEKEKIKTLISDISHQTKTPIANIQLYSELLDEMELPQSAKEYTFQLHTQTEKLSFPITSLVKLSRLETGIVALHPENGSISQLAEEVAASYMEKAAAKGLKLSVQPAEDCQGVFDRKWTAEALGNIIDNGIKYTNSGSVIVSVKRYEMFVCIEISDTGIGIQEQEMSQVFTRFYRGKDTQEQEGVGIGLYLAREIILAEGGYIKVNSAKGKGSVFSVFLPSAEQDASQRIGNSE